MAWPISARLWDRGCHGVEASVPFRQGWSGRVVLAGVQQRVSALRRDLFPQRAVLVLEDAGLQGLSIVFGRGSRRLSFWQGSFPAGLCRSGQPQNREALGDFLGDLLLEQGLVQPRLAVSLPAAACHWRVVSWPYAALPEDPRRALVELQADLRLPYSLNEAYLDIEPLSGEGRRSLLFTAPRALVEAWIEVFAFADVELERLEPAQVSEWRLLQRLWARASSADLAVVLGLGSQQTRLWLVQRGMPIMERWLEPLAAPLQPDALGALVLEVERCRRFCQQRQRQAPVGETRWFLHGEGAAAPELLPQLRALGVEGAQLVDPLQQGWLEGSGERIDLQGVAPSSLVRLIGLVQTEDRP